MGLFVYFHKKGMFKKSLNATFINLLPKVARAKDINKFRPTKLMGLNLFFFSFKKTYLDPLA